MERSARLEHGVRLLERLAERVGLEEGAVARRVHVREVEHGPDPVDAARDLDDVVDRAEVAHAAHHLDPEGHAALLRLEPLAQRRELLHDRVDRVLPAASEEEAGMEDDELGAARGDDAGAAVERADGGRELAPARLEMAHEPEERRVDGEGEVVLARELAEALGERVIHPEAALEVDLARGVAALRAGARRPPRATRGTAFGPGRRGCAMPRHDPRRGDVIAFTG